MMGRDFRGRSSSSRRSQSSAPNHHCPLSERRAAFISTIDKSVAAAVANAVYNASGVRVRDYPFALDKPIERMPGIGWVIGFSRPQKVAASSWGRAGRARTGLGRGGVGM
jgi:hypothetical protein